MQLSSFSVWMKVSLGVSITLNSLFVTLSFSNSDISLSGKLRFPLSSSFSSSNPFIINHASILGIYSKKVCGNNNDLDLLIHYFSRSNPLFFDEYTSFLNDKEIISKINDNISLKKINKRFIQLSKPMNSYCRKNYINFLGIIDKIIKTSQPYIINKSKRKPVKIIKKRKKKIVNNNINDLKANQDGIFQLSQFDEFMDIKNINNVFELGNNDYFSNNNINIYNNFKYDNFFNLNFDLSNLDSLSSIIYEI